MNPATSSLFSQLLSLVDRDDFRRLVSQTGSEARSKGFAWITRQLNMGTPDAVSRYVSEFKLAGPDVSAEYNNLTTKVMK